MYRQTDSETDRHTYTNTHTHTCARLRLSLAFLPINQHNRSALVKCQAIQGKETGRTKVDTQEGRDQSEGGRAQACVFVGMFVCAR